MECKFCHTENVDDAIYCKNCGRRIDGKKNCRACKRLLDEDAVFCNYCGRRADSVTAEQGEITVPETRGWKGVLGYVGTSAALLGVVISLVFVFLIGFGLNNAALLSQIGSSLSVNFNESVSIYDYFGKAYEQIAVISDQIVNSSNSDMYNFVEPALYLSAVICTVIAAGVLITVVTLSVFAIIKLIRKLMGKEAANAERYAFAAFLVYILGSALLRAFNNTVADIAYTAVDDTSLTAATVKIRLAVTYNPATIAGIVISAVCMGTCLACKIATKGRELANGRVITNVVLTAVTLAFAGIVAHYASCASHAVISDQGSTRISMTLPTSSWLLICAQRIGLTKEAWNNEFFLIALTMILQIAVIALAVVTLIIQVFNALNRKQNPSLLLSGTLLIACIAYLVIGAVATIEPLNTVYEGQKMTFIPCIVALIFGALNFGIAIARTVMNKSAIQTANGVN